MLLSDFIYIGAEFEVQEVGLFDVHSMSMAISGVLKISGKEYPIKVRQTYGKLAKIIQCCADTPEEATVSQNELWNLRAKAIQENQNGIKGIILKRYFNLFLWTVAMVILLFSVLATLYVAFGLHHPLFSFFFFVPLFAMFVHGLSRRVILTEPLYGTKASEIWVDEEKISLDFSD
ncbi:MAG: hypothetical protein ACI4FY_04660 [Acetatifactor sp.]